MSVYLVLCDTQLIGFDLKAVKKNKRGNNKGKRNNLFQRKERKKKEKKREGEKTTNH